MPWPASSNLSSVPQTSPNDADTLNREQQRADNSAYQRPLVDARASSGYFAGSRYGAIDDNGAGRPSRRPSPEIRRDSLLNRVPEEEPGADEDIADDPDEVEWNLQEQGLYPGSYTRILALHTFVPLSSLLLLGFLALCPRLFWLTAQYQSQPERHPPYFPFPVSELLLSASVWSLGYLLRTPLFALVSSLLDSISPFLVTVAFNILHALVYNTLRLSPLPILRVRDTMIHDHTTWHDPAFATVWWLALGWAATDVSVGIWQGYCQLALYRNVLVSAERVPLVLARARDGSAVSLLSASQDALPLSPRGDGDTAKSHRTLDDAIREAVDQDLEQLVSLKEREDVEEIYGLPVIKIPVFIFCLQRIDSILLSTGLTLTLCAAYLNSSLSLSISSISSTPNALATSSSNRAFWIAFPCIMLLNLFLNLLYSPTVLPRVGVHTSAYIGFVLGLGAFFTGLGLWRALA